MRSLLFVPGDDEKKIAKGLASGADVLILDLEDSVAASRKPAAREIVLSALKAGPAPGQKLIVRVNALTSGMIEADLDAVIAGAPAAIMLPKCEGGVDLQHASSHIALREAEAELEDGTITIVAIATETPLAIFRLGTIPGASRRLSGLTWGAEDLASALGAETNRAAGLLTEPFRLARNMALFAAHAAEVAAIDSVYTDFRNDAGLKAECEEARRDGFTAKMAIHPAQVPIINAVFTPDEAALAHAKRVIQAFIDNPDAGVVGIDGKMIDKPHLVQAERLMARAKAAGL
jgi:citrate lyase subunit beta / citryl-CoA lyase